MAGAERPTGRSSRRTTWWRSLACASAWRSLLWPPGGGWPANRQWPFGLYRNKELAARDRLHGRCLAGRNWFGEPVDQPATEHFDLRPLVRPPGPVDHGEGHEQRVVLAGPVGGQ